MSTIALIVNPRAGRGASLRAVEPLKRILERRGTAYEMTMTRYPGDAIGLARDSLSDLIVAVGGDGTINEVANGILGSGKTLGIIPAGSGNDFVKSLAIPRHLERAVDTLLAGRTRDVDVGVVEIEEDAGNAREGPKKTKRYFVNGIGIGFAASVAVRTTEIKYLGGTALYLLAVLQTLGKYRSPEFTIRVDSMVRSSRHLLIAVGNGACSGGGFYLTPDARVDDGLFDVCLVDEASIPRILRLMPKVMRGAHRGEKEIDLLRGRNIRIENDFALPIHVDGEILGRHVVSTTLEFAGPRLRVIEGWSGA